MKSILAFLLLLVPSLAMAEEYVYEGPWQTNGGRHLLNGTMTCVVVPKGDPNWEGKFTGVWQGAPFSYTIQFSGAANNLTGRAVVDGTDYTWTGKIDTAKFQGSFTGGAYTGSFSLPRKK